MKKITMLIIAATIGTISNLLIIYGAGLWAMLGFGMNGGLVGWLVSNYEV